MAKDTVYSALKELGFGQAGLNLYGTWGGYAVSVVNLNGGFHANIAVRLDKADKQTAKTVTDALRAQGLTKTRCNNLGDHLQVFLRFDNKTSKTDQFRNQINIIINQLRAMGIEPAPTCAVCGAGSPESLCLMGSTYQPVHRSCVENTAHEAAKKVEDNKANGSYLLGTLGAIIGALVGLIPSVITILAMEYIYAVLFALVPLCAAFGYKKFGGKRSVGMIVIIVILSLLSVFTLQFLVAAYYIADGHLGSIGTAFIYVVKYYMNPEGIGYVISQSLMEFLFMAIGILIAWRYVGSTNVTEMKRVSAVMDTLRANPALGAAAAARAESPFAQPMQPSWNTGTVAKPDFSADDVPRPTWDAGTVARPDWNAQVDVNSGPDSGASFDAGGRKNKPNGFDV